jgi:glycosyltransferase involved in cell wall biosynthesis
MRVLLTLHHHLDPDLGAPGATLAMGRALEGAGCQVDYLSFEKVYGGRTDSAWNVRHSLRFPWRAADFLARHGAEFDVVDASTGDAWVWASRGRPGAQPSPALVTRSHGLEHIADRQARAEAKAAGTRLSWKYPVYHGGFRLWEVARSMRLAHRVILLNEFDREFARDVLKVAEERLAIVPMGVADYFFGPDLLAGPPASGAPLRLAFLGSWIPRKGNRTVIEMARLVREAGLAFELTLMGTGSAERKAILAEFDPAVREAVRVIPRFAHTGLPDLLRGVDVLLFPSLAEGFSRALIEAMACGLAPVATPVGGAPAVIRSGDNGILVPAGDAAALARAVTDLARAPERLLAMRRRAQEDAAQYRWDSIARQTVAVYEDALRIAAHPAAAYPAPR